MKVGLQLPIFNWPGGAAVIGPKLAEVGRMADEAGFSSLWVMDHFFQIPMVGQAEEPMLEGYSVLSYLAAVTGRVTLGTLVTGVIYRYPGILAKTVTTLDVLSGGRAWLGIGAAWFDREAQGLGVPYPPLKDRFEMLEEALQIAHQMFKDDLTPYSGKHYQLAEPMNHPQPLSQPHPRIMIGGAGEQKTLRMVAQYADACNLFGRMPPDELRRKLDILKGHCEALGRPYEEIERTILDTAMLIPGGQTPAEIVAKCRAFADLGFQHVIFNTPNVHELTPLEVFEKEIIPAVAEF